MNFVNRHIEASAHSAITHDAFAPSLSTTRKWPIRYESIGLLAVIADVGAILLASVLSELLCRIHAGWSAADFGKAFGSALVVTALFVPLLKMHGMYGPTELRILRSQIRAVCLAWTFVFLLLASAVGALNIGHEVPHDTGLAFALLGLATLVANRTIARVLLAKGLSGRKFAGGNIVLITDQPRSRDAGLEHTLAMLGFRVTAHFRLPAARSGSDSRKRASARVIEHIRESDIEEVIVEADPSRWPDLRAFVSDLRVLPLPVVFVPTGGASEIFKRPTRDIGSTVCVELQRGPLNLLDRTAKRFIDLAGATAALILLSPLLAAVAVAIKFDSRGPVLFRQQRCGFNGRSFAIYKFRTMTVLEDGPQIIQAGRLDNRVTRIGKWLRRTSIDELPQLLNVLNGSMSLVGPRPHAVAHDGQFTKVVRHYAFRRRVKPGLTGWAQVHGCRGATPTAALIERRVQYDLWYIDNWSLRLDIKILLRTPIEVLSGRNAY